MSSLTTSPSTLVSRLQQLTIQPPLLTDEQIRIRKAALYVIAAVKEMVSYLPRELFNITISYLPPEDYIKYFLPEKYIITIIQYPTNSTEFHALTHVIDPGSINAAIEAFSGILTRQDLRNLVKNMPEACKKMKSIQLDPTCTDVDLLYLSFHFPNLQTLNLTKCKKITNTGLIHLASFKQLRSLNLTECPKITDSGLADIAKLRELKNLSLDSWHITDSGLADIAKLRELKSLSLYRCWCITGAGLAHLRTLTQLESLNLVGCQNITDIGLIRLASFKQLRSLKLTECFKITDSGLVHIAKLTKLESLNLDFCKNITDRGINNLRIANPSLKISKQCVTMSVSEERECDIS